jgi:hypothetical protein
MEAKTLAEEDLQRIQELEEKRRHIVEESETEELFITNHASFTHWYSHINFYKKMNPVWVKEQLELRKFAKYPFFHIETVLFPIILIGIIYFLLNIREIF